MLPFGSRKEERERCVRAFNLLLNFSRKVSTTFIGGTRGEREEKAQVQEGEREKREEPKRENRTNKRNNNELTMNRAGRDRGRGGGMRSTLFHLAHPKGPFRPRRFNTFLPKAVHGFLCHSSLLLTS